MFCLVPINQFVLFWSEKVGFRLFLSLLDPIIVFLLRHFQVVVFFNHCKPKFQDYIRSGLLFKVKNKVFLAFCHFRSALLGIGRNYFLKVNVVLLVFFPKFIKKLVELFLRHHIFELFHHNACKVIVVRADKSGHVKQCVQLLFLKHIREPILCSLLVEQTSNHQLNLKVWLLLWAALIFFFLAHLYHVLNVLNP